MGEQVNAGRSWRDLRFAAIQLASAGAGLLAWVLLPRVASGIDQEPAIIAFALGPILALPLTLGIPATLPNAFRRNADGAYANPGSWTGPMRVVCGTIGAAAVLGLALSIIGRVFGFPLETAAVVSSYAAGMGTWLIAAQVARIRESSRLMLAGGLLNPTLPVIWILVTGSGLPSDAAALASVVVITALCALVWLGMGSLVRMSAPRFAGDAKRALLLAIVLVPHLALFAVLMQGIRLSAIVVGEPHLLEQAHLASLGVTMVSVLVNAIHALLAVRIQTSHDDGLVEAVRGISVGYSVLALASTSATIAFYLILPFLSGVEIPFAIAVPLGASVPAVVVYYASSAIQLRSGSASKLLTSSCGAVALWSIVTALVRPTSLLGLAWVFAVAPASLAIIALVLGSIDPDPRTRAATRLMVRRVSPAIGGSMVLLIGAGTVSAALGS